MNTPKKTPFYDIHVAKGAKMVTFAGFEMPIVYTSIIEEHQTVRTRAGLFDVSHMGEFFIEGTDAESFLNFITINDVSALADGQAQYSAMCYPDGGIVDDLIIYRFEKNRYMMVVNAGNVQKDFSWIKEHLSGKVSIKNDSDAYGLLALQGPASMKILSKITDVNLRDIQFYHFVETNVAGFPVILSRTGYTGEPGFEFYHKTQFSKDLWQSIMKAGDEYQLAPVGLGARDTLRLEMKYCLYGNDIDQTTNPIEAGLGWITKTDKNDFIGKDAIMSVKTNKPDRKLVGFIMEDRAIPRHGYNVYAGNDAIGIVTSGTQSPTLNKAIGLAYIHRDFAKIGSEILINIRNRMMKAVIVKTPFVDSKPTE